MKKSFHILILLLLSLTSCDNSLNKSILEPLTVDELKYNMDKDSTFTNFYEEIQKAREIIMKSDIYQAQYCDVTYKQIYKFLNSLKDSTYINEFKADQRKIYDSKFPNYKLQVDSILAYWSEQKTLYDLKSYVHIEFSDLWKEYYSYSGDVKDVNIGFKITPLKGTIEQLIFRYSMKSKISNDGGINVWDSHRCLSPSPISASKTLYWEADYSDEKVLKSRSSEEIKRDYDFNIEIVEVRVDGENIGDKIKSMPNSVEFALDCYSGLDDFYDYYSTDIIKELIDPNYIDFNEYVNNALMEDLKNKEPKVYDFIEFIKKESK